ncbi:MAG TPA: class I SAM-dependent methyltransferase [Nocardioidaceae bacterium]|nr:class I SAM-dependent methyltransferase [Nocardioidaceae bacterium]
MSLGYTIMYRIGFTPWEWGGGTGSEHLRRLLDQEAQERAGSLGKALDVGCGRGSHSLELAGQGWQVTGVDAVGRAIADAKARGAGSGVRFLVADVTDLAASGIGVGFDFFLDAGCFHGLTDAQRAAEARNLTAAATDTATLLMFAFSPGPRRGPLPRGVDRAGVERAFAGWTVVDQQPAPAPLRGPLKSAAPSFYRLRRS